MTRRDLGAALLGGAHAWAAGPVALDPLSEAGYPALLTKHRGKVVLASFWATWCMPCREEMPGLVRLQQKLQPRGLVLVTVSADEASEAASALRMLRQWGIAGPAYIQKPTGSDEQFINAIDRQWSGSLPALFLYDRQGRKLRSFVGESDLAQVEAAILKAL